jgi:hypothetical protein
MLWDFGGKVVVEEKINDDVKAAQDAIDDLKLAERVFNEDRVGEAFALFNNLETFILNLSEESRQIVQNYIESSTIIQKLKRTGNQLLHDLALFHDNDSWNPWNSNLGPHRDVTLSVHRNEAEGQYYLKTEGFLRNVELVHATAALLENDMHRHWIPMCTQSKTVEELSAYRRIVQMNFDFVLLKKIATMEV